MTRKDFFEWCGSRGLIENTVIAAVFGVSSQMVRNWRKGFDSSPMPDWIPLACDGFDALRDGNALPVLPPVTAGWFKSWQTRNGLDGHEATARVFSITRQAVFNWFRRGRFPKWLALSCAGYEARIRRESHGPGDTST